MEYKEVEESKEVYLNEAKKVLTEKFYKPLKADDKRIRQLRSKIEVEQKYPEVIELLNEKFDSMRETYELQIRHMNEHIIRLKEEIKKKDERIVQLENVGIFKKILGKV